MDIRILKTPREYAEVIKHSYLPEQWVLGAFDAAKSYPTIPSSYWAEVVEVLVEVQL